MLQKIINSRRKFIKQAAMAGCMLAMGSCSQTSKLCRLPIGSDALKTTETLTISN